MKKLLAVTEVAFGAAVLLAALTAMGYRLLHNFANPLHEQYFDTYICAYLGLFCPLDICLLVDGVLRWREGYDLEASTRRSM